MKRIGVWVIYVVGALSICYLALFAYNMWAQPKIVPGDPIKMFRKQDAPSYS